MTEKNIKTSDILGSNYYTFSLSSSDYTPSLNGNITITCTVKSVYGGAISGKSITLYHNGSSVSSKTTNSSGVATWTYSCSSGGLHKFNVENESIEVFVDNKSNVGHTHTISNISNFPSLSTVATTGSYDDLTDKPNIPSGVVVDTSLSSSSNNAIANSTVKSALDGKIDTGGTGLSKSGTTLNHSNSVTALTTASLKKVEYDAQGHITGTSDVSGSDLPSHTHSEYANPTIVTNTNGWNSTTSDSRVPSEKLVKNSLDDKVDKENGKGLFSGSYSDLTNKPSYTATVNSSTTGSYKIGSINISGSSVDIYGKDTNTEYSHPTYSNVAKSTSALYKIKTNSLGHIIEITEASASDIGNLGVEITDTVYTHPTYTSKTSGLYKITVDSTGHISGTASVSASDLPSHTHSEYLTSHQSLKTINNESIVGTGNITITGGGNVTVDSSWVDNSTNPVQSKVIKSALDGKANSSHTHNATEIRDSSAHNRIGSGANDNQANINDSIDYALVDLDGNILSTKMDLVGFQKFQVKDFINPNNWESSGCTYSDGVLTFSGSNSFTATFPTDSLVGELADFELSFDYIIDDGLVLGDTIDFDIFGRETNYTVAEDDINNGYVIIDVSFKSENNYGIITSEQSGDEWTINDVGSLNPYTINAISPVGDYTKITNIKYKANNIISLNDNKEDVYNKVTSISSSSTNTQYPSAKAVYDSLDVKEDKSNKVTSISSSSTDTQYPSAKCVYNQLAKKLDKQEDSLITVTNGNIILSDYHTKDRWSYEGASGGSITSTTLISGSQGNAFYSYNFPSNVTSVTMQFSSDSTNAYIVGGSGDYTRITNSETTYTATSDWGLDIEIYDANKTVTYTITSITFNMKNWIDKIYPIGATYISTVEIEPSTLFGGVWEQIKDRFLLGSGDTYSNGATGGSSTVALTKAQMPRHTHTQAQHRHKQANKYSDGTGSVGAYMYTSNRTAVDHYTDYQTPVINHTGGTGTTNADANGSPHENMPPYLAVYMWKRIA